MRHRLVELPQNDPLALLAHRLGRTGWRRDPECQRHRPDSNLVAVLQDAGTAHGLAVQEGSVLAAQILQMPLVCQNDDPGVMTRDAARADPDAGIMSAVEDGRAFGGAQLGIRGCQIHMSRAPLPAVRRRILLPGPSGAIADAMRRPDETRILRRIGKGTAN